MPNLPSKLSENDTKQRKTFHFRLYPTRRQVRCLEEWLELCCELYNAALDERKSAYRMASLSLSYEAQCAELPGCKAIRPDLGEVPSQVLQEVLKREEVHAARLPACSEAVGIDVGLSTFAYLSTGEAIANPRFFRTEESALARAQRQLASAPKGSKRQARKRKVVARVHERIGNRRNNFIEQEVCKLIKRFGLLAVEALAVRNMVRNPKLAKSIADVSWSQYFARLAAKAEEAGRYVVRVNPAYTSQTCSACSHRQPMPLSVRVFECPRCGLNLDRDHNGSKNILVEALIGVGRHTGVIPEAPGS